jgi:autotransporter-associated beta strand protein
LDGATLRVGGGAGKSVTWTGPVSVTADSSIRCDGSTAGITLSGNVTMDGVTLTSSPNGTSNTISGAISGTGTIMTDTFSNGTLNLNAANSFTGTFRSALGTLRIGNALAMQNGVLEMNAADSGQVNLNNLNAVIGALTGTRNLSLGSGTVSIGNNNASTTYGGVLSGGGSLVKTGIGTLTLSGANSYTGTTTISAGTLALGAGNVLPVTAVSIANATLHAAAFANSFGTLDPTGSATIHLEAGSALAFADSSGVDWTGGGLNITGNFVSGSSLRFGGGSNGLTSTQLNLITVNGSPGPFALDAGGYLGIIVPDPFDIWKTQITNGLDQRADDADGDGFSNYEEFLFGTSPIAGNRALVMTNNSSGAGLLLRWLQRESGASYVLRQSTNLAAGSWTTVASPSPALDGDQSGAPADYDYFTVTIPTSGGTLFYRIEGVEN